jgi:hypothetical protein
MSRAATGDVVTVPPTSNVYTVLVIAAVVVQIVGLIALCVRHSQIFDKGAKYLFF